MTSERKSGKGAQGSRARNAAPPAPAKHSRGWLNLDAEQRSRLLIIGSAVLVLGLAIGFIAFGWYYSVERPRHRTVLQVDDIKVSYESMRRRMDYEYFQNLTYQQSPDILAAATFQQVLNELTQITRAESSLGVVIDEAEVDRKLRTKIGVAEDADQRTFTDSFRRALDTSGLTEDEYRRLVRAEVLQEKAQEKYRAELSATTPQARLEVIVVETEQEANRAIERINGGQEFAAVAREVSDDPDVAETGGVEEYAPEGSFNPAYDDYAFTGEIGRLSVPLAAGPNGPYYVVRIIDRSEQPVKEEQKDALADEKFTEWLTTTQEDMRVNGALTSAWEDDDQADALLAVLEDAIPRQQAEQRRQQEQQNQQATLTADLTANPQPQPSPLAPGAQPPAAGTPAPSAPEVPVQPVAPGSGQ